ncbi:MAG TPA: VCBS repeat-containing protein, partial [Candidatus Margulisiibacteriota bacterium]|nr:VCBS repeat-containing protein [Candidatus Margulisiibacteriota bacterium]
MTRGFCATLVVVGCAMLLRTVCLAQITFVPGPQRSVPPGPTFAAAARDLDGDGIADMVVSHTLTAKITVLFGSTDGSFKSAITRQVGRLLRGVTTADFNGDHNEDIAVVDVDLSRVFILAGDGSGGLNPTGNFVVARSGPYGIATGNFDNKKDASKDGGPDIVTANGNADNISTLFNKGR